MPISTPSSLIAGETVLNRIAISCQASPYFGSGAFPLGRSDPLSQDLCLLQGHASTIYREIELKRAINTIYLYFVGRQRGS
jgi:hypothetical protein